jgi:hypothetical protein
MAEILVGCGATDAADGADENSKMSLAPSSARVVQGAQIIWALMSLGGLTWPASGSRRSTFVGKRIARLIRPDLRTASMTYV